MPRKRLLHELTLDNNRAVDFPAQEPATMAIIKRSYTAAQRTEMAGRGVAMPDGRYRCVERCDGRSARASTPSPSPDVKAHIIGRAKALDATDQLPDDWAAGDEEGNDMPNDFPAKVAMLRRDGLSRTAAMSKVAAQHPELVESYRKARPAEPIEPDAQSVAIEKARRDFHAEVQKLAASAGVPRHAAMSRLACARPDLHAAAFSG